MISHKHKCIFIHIPRTGGSSIEKALVGQNWWSIEKTTKHLTVAQAKDVYSSYWDAYFKFAFVRNPWDRYVSLLAFAEMYYGTRSDELTRSMIEEYKRRFGYPVTVEYDYRFYSWREVVASARFEQSVYLNILGKRELDFVGKYENLDEDFAKVCRVLGVLEPSLGRLGASAKRKHSTYRQYYDERLRNDVAELYAEDISFFGYKF